MSGFAVGDVLDFPTGSRNLYPITLKSYDPNTRTWAVQWACGTVYHASKTWVETHPLVKIGAAKTATFQVGDVVEITRPDLWDYAVNAWPRVENRWTVDEVFTGGDIRVKNDFGSLCVLPGEIRKVAKPAAPSCDCSARDLAWNGHRCGLANSDPWRALAGMFE